MKIFICANLYKEKTANIFPDVIRSLKLYGMTPLAENRFCNVCRGMNLNGICFGEAEENAEKCDFFLTIGGDGTILRWGKKGGVLQKAAYRSEHGQTWIYGHFGERESFNAFSCLRGKIQIKHENDA